MDLKTFNKYWDEIVEHFEIPSHKSEILFNEIINLYRDTKRHYHNLSHILDLLKLIDNQNLCVQDRIALILAAIYHDAIYTAGSQKNEIKSANLLRKHFIQINESNNIVELAINIIIETQNHKSEHHLSKLFLDIDMSILGANNSKYNSYVEQVRKEHQKFPSLIYKVGRKRFIQSMLNRQPLFYTKQFNELYEAQAIKNLKRELKTL